MFADTNIIRGTGVGYRRQEEGTIDQRVLVVDWELSEADDASHGGGTHSAETGEDQTADLIIAVRSLVLRLDVVCILGAVGQRVEDLEVCAVSEDVSCGRVVGVQDEVKAVLATAGHVVTRRGARGCAGGRACGAWGAGAAPGTVTRKTGALDSEWGTNLSTICHTAGSLESIAVANGWQALPLHLLLSSLLV